MNSFGAAQRWLKRDEPTNGMSMPTYTSVNFRMQKSSIYPALVEDVYKALSYEGEEGIRLHVVPQKTEEMTLNEVTSWNQARIQSNFCLAPTQHFSNDYKQVELMGTPYSTCRAYFYNETYLDFFSLHLIVPEECVARHGAEILKELAKSVIKRLPVVTVSTSNETAATTATIELCHHEELCVEYFGYAKHGLIAASDYFKLSELEDGLFVEYAPA